MPSPFPGMDPFIESQEWSDFHTTAITVVRELLTPRLGERYTARVERRVYVEHDPPSNEPSVDRRHIEPDVAVVRESDAEGGAVATEAIVATAVECELPKPETHREAYLVLREIEVHEVVAVIELLSPTNKRSGTDGRREYSRKREEVLDSDSHLIEIDLLRGGLRMPARPRSPITGDYVVLVSRSDRRPRGELFSWSLRQKLPTIPIPLRKGDADVSLDLQVVLNTVFDRARYDLMLNYSAPLVPPADAETQKWIDRVLGDRKSSSSPK